MDLHSLLSGESPENQFEQVVPTKEDLDSSKQSSVAFNHDQLLEQIGLKKETTASQVSRAPILQINIQMKDGLEIINVYEGDEPIEVAREFVGRYPDIMSDQAVEILTMQINQKLNEINRDAKRIGETEENQPLTEESDSPEEEQNLSEPIEKKYTEYDEDKDLLTQKELTVISDKSSEDDDITPDRTNLVDLEKRAQEYLSQPDMQEMPKPGDFTERMRQQYQQISFENDN